MQQLAANTISVFRNGLALSSSTPTQLRLTIQEMEQRIDAQNMLINEQQLALIAKEEEIAMLREELNLLSREQPPGYEQYVKSQKLTRTNEALLHSLEELEEAFDRTLSAVIENLNGSLAALDDMPATAETASMHARATKEMQAIMRAKKLSQISPANCLRQLADVERGIVSFITSRPALTFRRADHFRGELLIETLFRDKDMKAINSPQAAMALSTAEEWPISRKQACRAMAWAAQMHPDKVLLHKRGFGAGKSWRLCKIDIEEADKR